MGRRTPKQLAESRRRILRAAERLFSARGFAHAQVAEIAKEARVGIGAFYRQFAGKEDVLRVILGGLFADIRGKLVAMRTGIVDQSPLEQLRVIHETFKIVFGVFSAHPAVTLTMLRSGYGMTPAIEKRVWNELNEIAEDVAADVARARRAGLLAIRKPRYVGDVLVGMVLHVAHRMLVDRHITVAEASRFCTRFTIGGLLAFTPPETMKEIASIVFDPRRGWLK